MEEHRYEVNLTKVETPLKVHAQDDTSTLDVQDTVVDDTGDNQKVDDSDEADKNPPIKNVESKKEAKEVGDEKGEDVKKGEEEEKAEKETNGDKIEQVPTARDTVTVDKEKQIITNTYDLTKGPIDLISLSLVQALKLAALS